MSGSKKTHRSDSNYYEPSQIPAPTTPDSEPNQPDLNELSHVTKANFPEPVLKRNLMLMLWDVACYSVMVGMGEQFFSLFVLALNYEHKERVSGLVTTVPLLIGACLQLITPWGVRWVGSSRRWTVLMAVLQSLCFIPLMLGAMAGWMPIWMLYFCVSIYWATSLSAGSGWNVWITGIVPIEIRSTYLARRSRVGQVAQLFAFALGGIALNWGEKNGQELSIFALVFGISCVCRFLSGVFLYFKTESFHPHNPAAKAWDWNHLRGIWRKGQPGPLLLYLWVMYAAAFISGPYFAVYYKKQLNCDYHWYIAVAGTMMVAKILTLQLMGHFAKRHGVRYLMVMSGLMIIPLPVFWTLGSSMPYILFLQVIGGVYWGAFELAIVLMFIEAIPVRRRTSILTLYYLGYAVATVLGSLVGGYFLERFERGENAYFILFTLSGIGRSFSLFLVAFLPKPLPHVEAKVVSSDETRSPEERAEIEQLIHDDSQISHNVGN